MGLPKFKIVDGRKKNGYLGYSDCVCGRSSRWYEGITEQIDDCKKFTCVFCLSNTEEGSDDAIVIYGHAMGGKHIFIEVFG